MKELSGRERRRLRGMAHGLRPLVQIGKNGVTEGVIGAIDRALADNELIKVRFQDYKAEKDELSDKIASETRSKVVDIIGHTLILYREN
jgi:RNA-binding protein